MDCLRTSAIRTRFYGVRFLANLKGCFLVLERASTAHHTHAHTTHIHTQSLSFSPPHLFLSLSLSPIQTHTYTHHTRRVSVVVLSPLTLSPSSFSLSLSLTHTYLSPSSVNNNLHPTHHIQTHVRALTHTHARANTHTHTHISPFLLSLSHTRAHSPHISPFLLSLFTQMTSARLAHTYTHALAHPAHIYLPVSLS